jgi:hypothetical protein
VAVANPGGARDVLARLLEAGNGVLRCEPAWVARDFLPPGRRLGLPEHAYDLGERGAICERLLLRDAVAADPETFFGVHPWIVEESAHEVLLPYLVDWNSDLILRHARAELQVAGEGFHVPSGVLHAPGTALTLELQEDSDVLSMFQALNGGRIISKDLLFKDVRPQDREERFPLGFVDWEINGDPWFYENRHLSPQPVAGAAGDGEETWVFYNTSKYAGKRLVVPPGGVHRLREPGVYSAFAWTGEGGFAGHEVRGGEPGRDELVVTHHAATREHEVANTGVEDLVVFLFFGPDLHMEAPSIAGRTR